jgi:hypothetical protein
MNMWQHCSVVGIFLMAGTMARAALPEAPKRVIIDTDPGTDDALAILLALNSPELKVEALTVVPGNVTAAQGLENALKLVSLAGRTDLPVAAGAQKPLLQKLVTAETHGPNGLANINLPPARCSPDPHFAPDLIIELVRKYPHEITLVPVGPLTNIALALSKDPSIAELVKEVVLMGGSNLRRQCRRRRRIQHLRGPRSGPNCVQEWLPIDDGRIGDRTKGTLPSRPPLTTKKNSRGSK